MKTIIHSFEYCLDFLRHQISDVDDDQMVLQAEHNPNHPAWVLGHLSFSCQAIGGEIGLTPWLPDGWAKKYGMGSVPVQDIAAYDSKEASLQTLSNAQSRICKQVLSLSDAKLQQPLPDKNYEKDLPSIAHALVQVLVAHTAYHNGQLTIWRRAVGLPKIERPFL